MSEFFFNTKWDAEAVAWRLREAGVRAFNVQNVIDTEARVEAVDFACRMVGVVRQGEAVGAVLAFTPEEMKEAIAEEVPAFACSCGECKWCLT